MPHRHGATVFVYSIKINHNKIRAVFRLRYGEGQRSVFIGGCLESLFLRLGGFDECGSFLSRGKLREIAVEVCVIGIAGLVADGFDGYAVGLVRLKSIQDDLRVVEGLRGERTGEIFAVALLGVGLFDIPEKDLHGIFRAADVAVLVLAEKLRIPESVEKGICVIGGLGDGLHVDESEFTVEGLAGRRIFLKNIGVDPIREDVGVSLASFDGAEHVRRVVITVVNGIGIGKRA